MGMRPSEMDDFDGVLRDDWDEDDDFDLGVLLGDSDVDDDLEAEDEDFEIEEDFVEDPLDAEELDDVESE